MDIRPLQKNQSGIADIIFAIIQDALPHSWSKQSLINLLEQPASFGWGLYDGSQMIGFLLANRVLEETEILSFAVVRRHQSQGYGRKLLRTLLQYCGETGIRSVFLDVAEDNPKAIHLYQSCGFTRYDVRPQYYIRSNSRVDAILMRWGDFK